MLLVVGHLHLNGVGHQRIVQISDLADWGQLFQTDAWPSLLIALQDSLVCMHHDHLTYQYA